MGGGARLEGIDGVAKLGPLDRAVHVLVHRVGSSSQSRRPRRRCTRLLLLFNLVSSLSISSLSTGLIAGGGGAGGGGGGVGILGDKKLITLLYV